MRLSGWKEIAGYLKSSVRTVQRWNRELHMPVMRVRSSSRGPVMADSAKLDEWLTHREVFVVAERRTDLLKKRATEQGHNFLWTELATGRAFAKLASSSTDQGVARRRQKAARKAYDTLQYYLLRTCSLPEAELKRFKVTLQEFRRELEKLGEKF